MYKGGVGNKTNIEDNPVQRPTFYLSVFNIYRLCSKICINCFVYYRLRIFLAILEEAAKNILKGGGVTLFLGFFNQIKKKIQMGRENI